MVNKAGGTAISVSIDGPTASGKTSLGRGLALRLGGSFVDTGLTYRVLAFALARSELPDDHSWLSFIEHRPLSFELVGGGFSVVEEAILYHGREITERLWGFDVENQLEHIARSQVRRAQIADYHRALISKRRVMVVAGRDVARTILTSATLHVYLQADFAVRRARRRAQHCDCPERPVVVGATTVRDSETRNSISAKPNSLVIDTTSLSKKMVLGMVESQLCKLT